MAKITRGYRILREYGFREFIYRFNRYIYTKFIRAYLPTTGYCSANGVKVEKMPILDPYLSLENIERPNVEGGIVSAHEKLTRQGDSVVVIGGGKGVTAVRAAKIVGEKGKIEIYEGGKKSVDKIQNVIKWNGVAGCCEVNHAIVGEKRDVYGGESTGADEIQPTEVPKCDVLELDCEGSEVDVLSNLSIRPRVIIAELHPSEFSENPGELIDILSNNGYEITHQFGHDGIPLSDEEFSILLNNSNSPDLYSKYLESGARYPVVIGAIHEEFN